MNLEPTIPQHLPEDDLEQLYEHAPCGYISTLPSGRIVRVNETFVEQIERTREELLAGVKFHELMTMAGRVFYDTHFAPLIRIRGFVKEIACDLVRGDGGKLPALVNAVQVMDAAGEPASIRFTVFDATERRRYEADLLAARRRGDHFKTIVQASADAIISVGPDGEIKTWNRGAEQMFGIPEVEAIGKKAWDVIDLSGASADFEFVVAELRSGRSVQRLDVANHPGGESIDVAVTITPHIEPPGELTGVSAIIRDVTERKRTFEARHKQELLQNLVDSQEAERQRFARDLHDHLGQKLTSLRIALAGLKAMVDDDIAKPIAKIEAEALQMDRDLSFLAFELRPNVLTDLGLFDALENFVSEWASNHAQNASFHAARSADRRLVAGIEINLYRIAQESLNNILKHAHATNVSVMLEERRSEIKLIIEDDGVGFSIKQNNKLRKIPGHGLGLLGMRERAAVIGGSLEVESEPGAGATIYVRVPALYV